MASSQVMSSTSQAANPDPPRHNSDHQVMDEILRNIYSDPERKTVEEVWREIVTKDPQHHPRMTLEDFLSKAGAVGEDDFRRNSVQFPASPMMNVPPFPASPVPGAHMQSGSFGMVAAEPVRGSGNGRGKRRAPPVEEVVLDKATQQKQRRMIKNRESAARSRERKQAYNLELESLVTQHEEENARILKEMAEEKKQRYNQLMKYLIPVVEKRRPPRPLPLRRVKSMSW